jgi:hypothetical protein
MQTREQHLQWCKKRALALIGGGSQKEISEAYASMLSDLGKHPDTSSSVETAFMLGTPLSLGGHLSTKEKMEEFINGFN